MAVLENVYHNFPRLARQSGFYFQLHKGRVNWSEIENLNVSEIIESRNFELLEQNLVNVINCNLEREYDFNILNKNFVKLFKLAQLGVDYLSYCEKYLDKCVVLLQEQLIAYQDECEILKNEIQKRKEVNRKKSKNKALNYQCEKCAKVFISDVYLKFHEKRRHSNTTASECSDGFPQKRSCNFQQIEEKKKLSTSTQTSFSNEVTAVSQENEDVSNVKTQHILKVENLEHELQVLKERLKKAESTLLEKTDEAPKSNVLHSVNIPNAMHCNCVMLLPSCLAHLGPGFCETNSASQMSVPEACLSNNASLPAAYSETFNFKPLTANMPGLEIETEKSAEKECKIVAEEKSKADISEIFENFQKQQTEKTERWECEKENVNPKITPNLFTNLVKPLPPPRKLKKGIQESSKSEITALVKRNTYTEEETENSTSHLIVESTPVKEKSREETNPEILEGSMGNISEISKPKANSTESLQSKKSVLCESGSKSFIKKLVTRDSPTIQKFSKNFKRSLNNFYDSISSTEKKVKKKDSNFQNLRTAAVGGLNKHLQQLGISSEWSSIPKETMRQKLSAWKHQKKFLKEYPLYPVVRQNIEEKVFQKLKKNFSRRKATLTKKFNKQKSMKITGSSDPEIQGTQFEDNSEFVKSKKCLMYETDMDSESRASDSLLSLHDMEQINTQDTVIVKEITSSEENADIKSIKEFDFSVFQVGGSSLSNVAVENQKPMSVNRMDNAFTDSDTEESLLETYRGKSVRNLQSCIETLHTDVENVGDIFHYENEKHLFKVSHIEKTEAESVLNDEMEKERFQSKSATNTQKKVLFGSYSKNTEEELSDNPTDDDLWSLKSNWEKNKGWNKYLGHREMTSGHQNLGL